MRGKEKRRGKRKKKGKKKEKTKKKKKDTCDGFNPKNMGKKENQKIKLKKKNGMSHNRKKKEMQRSVDRRPNRTSTVTGREGEKRSEDKKRILHPPK